MQTSPKRLAPAFIHLLAWVGFIVYEQSAFLLNGTPPPSYYFILILYPLNALLFYGISEGILPRMADRRPYWQSSLAVVGSMAAFAFARTELTKYLWMLFRITPHKYTYWQIWSGSFYRSLLSRLSALATGLPAGQCCLSAIGASRSIGCARPKKACSKPIWPFYAAR